MSDTRNLVLISGGTSGIGWRRRRYFLVTAMNRSFSGETKRVAALPLRQSPALISSAAM